MIDQRDYFALANDPRVRPVLDAIAMAEGTTEHGYHTMFGGGRIDDLSDHPRKKLPFTQTDGKRNYSSAAGQYQFLEGTWDDAANQLGLTDFSPANQDAAATFLIDRAGALDDLLNGNVQDAIDKLGTVWASLPNSPYAQPRRTEQEFQSMLDTAYGNSALPRTKASYATTQPQTNTQKEKPMASMLEQTLAKIAPTAQALGDLRQTPDFANSPELLELLSKKGRQDASMLPLAVGALLSGDKQFQQLGASMYQAGQEGRNPIKMGDYGFIDPSNGGFVENPMAAANNANADLSTAANLAGKMVQADATNNLANEKARQSFMQQMLSLQATNSYRAAQIEMQRQRAAMQGASALVNILGKKSQALKEIHDLTNKATDPEYLARLEDQGMGGSAMDVINSQIQGLENQYNQLDVLQQSLTPGMESAPISGQTASGSATPMPSQQQQNALPRSVQMISGLGSNQKQPNVPSPAEQPMLKQSMQAVNPNMQMTEPESVVPYVVPEQGLAEKAVPNVQMPLTKTQNKKQIEIPIGAFSTEQLSLNPEVPNKPIVDRETGISYTPQVRTTLGKNPPLQGRDSDGRKVYKRNGTNYVYTQLIDPNTGASENVYVSLPAGDQIFKPEKQYQESISAVRGLLADAKYNAKLAKIVQENEVIFDGWANFLNAAKNFAPLITKPLVTPYLKDYLEDNSSSDINPMQVRQKIAENSAKLIKQFYGAVLSLNEKKLADQFIPNQYSTPMDVVNAMTEIPAVLQRLIDTHGEARVAKALEKANIDEIEMKEIFNIAEDQDEFDGLAPEGEVK